MSGEPAPAPTPAPAADPTPAPAAPAPAASPNVLADAKPVDPAAPPAEAKPDGEKPPEAKADEKPADDKPIEYTDFKIPDGIEVDTATLGEAKTLLAGMKLPQDQAQQLVDFYSTKIKAAAEAQAKAWVGLQEKWVGEFKADKDIGGDRASGTISVAAKAMDRFGTPGLREALLVTGAGNHPEVIRFVANVGKAMAEDRFLPAGGGAVAKSAAEVIYPDQNKGN